MAHIPRHRRMQSRLVENVMQQVRHGGFAIGAGDSNPRAIAKGLPSHGHFTSHRHAVVA